MRSMPSGCRWRCWRYAFLIVASPVLAFQLRRREKSDPRFAPHPGHEHLHRKAELEDHDVSNQFTVFGDLKPGRFRLWTTRPVAAP